MSLREWPAALRKAKELGFFPYEVREVNGFPNNVGRSYNIATGQKSMPDNLKEIYWHHEASPEGPSRGLDWMVTGYNTNRPSAQIRMDYWGGVDFLGGGYAHHAGVTDGFSDSSNAVGVEVDHTTGETVNPTLLDALLRFFAVISVHENKTAEWVVYHKTRGYPYGRKPDFWFPGDDLRGFPSLTHNRAKINKYIAEYKALLGGKPPVTPGPTPVPTPEDEDETMQLVRAQDNPNAPWTVFAYSPGRFFHVPGMTHLTVGKQRGLWSTDDIGSIQRISPSDLNVLRDDCVGNGSGKGDNMIGEGKNLPSNILPKK